jgi:hypothetical protein
MDNHENLTVDRVTLIFPNFSEYQACADLVGKLILLLVTYFPHVSFLCEGHFPTIGYNVDYYSSRICSWSRKNCVLRVTTQTMRLELQQLGCTRICNGYLELQQLGCTWICNGYLELQQLDCVWNCRNIKCT